MGGLLGGMVFGMLMQVMGMLPVIAMLVGSRSVAVGWLVHLAISVVFGGGFGLMAGRRADTYRRGLLLGLGYGLVLWIAGGMFLMPLKLGMPVFQLSGTALPSMMGHMVFGLVLGAVSVSLVRRARAS